MSSLSKLGTALSLVFVVSLVALVAEIVYVLWRRRIFRRRSAAGDGGDNPELSGDSFSTSSAAASSKELLYFLCWKHQSRVEPDGGGGGGAAPTHGADGSSSESPAADAIDLLKLQGMYGPSRFLFTIKEEEREDADSEKSVSVSSAEKLPKKAKKVSLEECFSVAGDIPEEVTVTVEDDIHTTPFSTPCASPLYYTPSASPTRDWENELPVSCVPGDRTSSFVRLEVHGP